MPTRRELLGTSVAAAAGWAGAKVYAAGAAGKPGPNDTINMGLIGCGGRGRSVMGEFMPLPGVRIVAVADMNSARVEQARKQAGGEKVLPFHDYRKLLELRNLDAVIVGTNGHWHVLPTIHACQAGKDVYVEKPLSTSIGEGRAAVRAARKYDRVVQIGTQQHSWEHYQRAVELIQAGRLGDITEVKCWDMDYFYPGFGSPPDCDPPKELDWDFWLGPSPNVPYNPNRYTHHYWFFDYGGGWSVDWAVHHYDIIQWAMGVKWPIAAVALAGKFGFQDDNTQWPDTMAGVCEYGPGPVAKKGFLMQYTHRSCCRREQRSHSKIFFGSEASMILDRAGYTITTEIKGQRGAKAVEESFRGKGPNHAEVFLQHVRSRTRPVADVETGHYATNPGHLMNIAWRVGRKVRWDGEQEQILDDPEANALVTKKYRAPWTLDV